METVLVTEEIIHSHISSIMKSNYNTILHNQRKAIETLNRLYSILEGETCYPGYDCVYGENVMWKLQK